MKGGLVRHFFLGVDISKGYADFVILDKNKHTVEDNFQLDDTFTGHCRLYKKLDQFFKDHPGCEMLSALESTGGYENNWHKSLTGYRGTLNIKTARLNPMGVSANGKASLKRIVTDKMSARNVAEYLISHPEKVEYQQHDRTAGLRKQWHFVKTLVKQKTQFLNQLESLLYIAHPEVLAHCNGQSPRWFLTILTRYPTASSLSRAKAQTVAKISYITESRAEQLIENAKNSVASATDHETGQLIRATARQILHLEKTIRDQTEFMKKQCSIPEVELLKTFPGIGDLSAMGLMLEIQTVDRFPTVKKLASFFGLHPVFKISGDGSGGFKMSKQGRKEPRAILYMVVMAALNHNPLIQGIYRDRVENGMEKMAAIGLCMHKILRIVYGMLKNNVPFDPEVDRENRRRQSEAKSSGREDKNRRYQDYDAQAPVSKRQAKKRKERKKSHSVENAEDGIAASAQADG
jgi:transposase